MSRFVPELTSLGGPSDTGRYRQIDDIRRKRNIRHAIMYSPVTIALAYKLMNTLL